MIRTLTRKCGTYRDRISARECQVLTTHQYASEEGETAS